MVGTGHGRGTNLVKMGSDVGSFACPKMSPLNTLRWEELMLATDTSTGVR